MRFCIKNLNFIFFVLAQIPILCFASPLIVIGLNQINRVPIKPNESISLTKKEIAAIKDNGSELLIHGKKEGESTLRIGKETFKIIVLNPSKLEQFQTLHSTLQHTTRLTLDYQDNFFVLRGQIPDVSTWLSLANLNLSNFKIAAETNQYQRRMAEYLINKTLLKEGHFPIRILSEPFPTVRLPPSVKTSNQIREILSHYGLNMKEDEERIRPEPLIRVQVILAEVRKSFAQNIGIEWPYQISGKILPEGIIPSNQGSEMLAHFFARKGNGRILASPILMAKSGSSAEFFAGGEFPIKIRTRQMQAVNWKKYGITLKIKPTADSDGRINLELNSEVSSLDSGEKIDGVPSLFTNTISSHFDVMSNQTITLSGLVKKVDGESLKQWPGLGDIPVLGSLFTSREYQEDLTELVVLVTPFILN